MLNQSGSPHYREPRFRSALAERKILEVGVDLDPDRLDGFDAPALGERIVQLLFRDAPRPLAGRLLVAEAHEEDSAARLEDRCQSVDVFLPVLVRENVEQAAIDHIVEPLAPVLERQGIFDEERDGRAAFGCLLLRPLDGQLEKINARDLPASTGKEQSRIAGSATGVEDGSGDLVGPVEEGFLRLADVPRGLAGVKVLEGAAIGYGSHDCSSWGCSHRYPTSASVKPSLMSVCFRKRCPRRARSAAE